MSPLSSHPVPSAQQDEDAEEHLDEFCSIRVVQRPGYNCSVVAEARLSIAARTLWEQALCHPDNAAIFRHMDRCVYRKLVSLSPDGKIRTYEVEHEAGWRFLVFSGTFTTKLRVEEDHENFFMRFEVLPSRSILRKFNGSWHVEPDDENPELSISRIEQDIAIGVFMPPPFDRIFKRIACRQVRNIFEDLQAEALRIASGAGPTLSPYADVADKEIGVQGIEAAITAH